MNTTPRTEALAETLYPKSWHEAYTEMKKHAMALETELASAHKALMACDGAMMGKVKPSSVAFKMINAILRPQNAKEKAEDRLALTAGSPFVFCEADLKKGRKIKAEQGEGVFRFTLRDGRETRKIEMSDDEAWIVGKIISAMHPAISGSNDPLWHQIQEQRKIIPENAELCQPCPPSTPLRQETAAGQGLA